jgi:hypothetical protein
MNGLDYPSLWMIALGDRRAHENERCRANSIRAGSLRE